VALAGVISALRVQGKSPLDLAHQRVVCVGAGSAGLGVVQGIIMGMKQVGMTEEAARSCFWLVDKDGLLGRTREGISPAQVPFMRLEEEYHDKMQLTDVIKKVKPTILLGLSGVGGIFSKDAITEMAAHVARPIIFPLSNPDTRSECTAREAFEWTNGQAIVATGSPFQSVVINGRTCHPCQGNNMFIFPGVGLGAILSKTRIITDSMFYAAAKTLSSLLTHEEIVEGKVYPDISAIRDVSKEVAIAVIKVALEERLAGIDPPSDLRQFVEDAMYTPKYVPLIHDPKPH